jgi:Interferon-induced transmembrane protein/zinc-ribbon domain
VYCTKCGTRNEDTATSCIQCGNELRPAAFGSDTTAPPSPPPPPEYQQAPIAQAYMSPPATPSAVQVPNYLVHAILVTFFCCLPLGIVSIIYATQVNTKLALGDIQGAIEASKQAKLFAWIGFGVTAGLLVLYLLFVLLVALGMIASSTHVH